MPILKIQQTTLQVKLVSLENRYDKLSDDLWGEETGIALPCVVLPPSGHFLLQPSDLRWLVPVSKDCRVYFRFGWLCLLTRSRTTSLPGLAKVMHDLSHTNEVAAHLDLDSFNRWRTHGLS